MSNTLLGMLGGAAGAALAAEGYNRLGDIGEQAYDEFAGPGGLADRMSSGLEFRPYTVTSATGGRFGMSEGPDGAMNYNLSTSPEEQALQESQLGRASMFFDQASLPVAEREQEVYNRMRGAMLPEEERQRLALEERLFNQGRSGIRTSMFGGTPEQLALAKAQEEAKYGAMLNAMQFAGQEQQRQAGIGTGMLAAGYVPQAQLITALQPGMNAAEAYRSQQTVGQQGYGETYATGLEALLQSGLGQANLLGGLGTNLATTSLGGLFK